MKALASTDSAIPKQTIGRTRTATARPAGELHRRAADTSTKAAPISATTIAMTIADTTGPTAIESSCSWTAPSSEANAAKANRTTGVARPSLSPLSTLSARRIRIGTRGLRIVGAPRPASVGVTAPAIRSAPATPKAGRSHPTNAKVMPSASGKPMANSRSAMPESSLSAPRRTVEASWKRMTTRVTSARTWTASLVTTSSPVNALSSAPATRNNIGAVTFQRDKGLATNT